MKKLLFILLDLMVKLFYPRCRGILAINVLGSVFFTQKILGFNRFVPWPCHHSSTVVYRKNVKLGNRSFPGWSPGCYIQARNGIRIGNNLRMGPGVGLISSNHELDDYDQWTQNGPIEIGDNVWLGMGVIVTAGVKIGDNVVIGANSVVTRDIPSNSIALGIPCKVVDKKPPYVGYSY